MSARAQFAVRKQGSIASGNWSTRTLTIDTDTATATVSRRNHPNNLLYHSLEVKVVQMWPRYLPETLDDDYTGLQAKMTLRIVGKEVPVPLFTADDEAVVNTSTLSWSAAAAAHAAGAGSRSASGYPSCETSLIKSPVTSDFAFTAGDSRKKSRPLRQDSDSELYEVWMVRFTAIEAYEAAVTLFGCLRNSDGSPRKVYGDHFAVDLATVKQAWAEYHGLKPTTPVKPSNQLSKDPVTASGN